jgi:hypothetical protein
VISALRKILSRIEVQLCQKEAQTINRAANLIIDKIMERKAVNKQ